MCVCFERESERERERERKREREREIEGGREGGRERGLKEGYDLINSSQTTQHESSQRTNHKQF